MDMKKEIQKEIRMTDPEEGLKFKTHLADNWHTIPQPSEADIERSRMALMAVSNPETED